MAPNKKQHISAVFYLVPSIGIEPIFKVPQTFVLSIERRGPMSTNRVMEGDTDTLTYEHHHVKIPLFIEAADGCA